MKRPNLAQWREPEKLQGLLLFAQAFEELLFDHTLDTYAVPALNSHFILHEFLFVSRDIERGDLKSGALRPVAEELLALVRSCPVMRKILSPDLEWVLQPFEKAEERMRLARDRARHLAGIADGRYFPTLRELLQDVVPGGKEKERILHLTRCLVCELVNHGYSPKHLYYKCLDFFFQRQVIHSPDQMGAFLDQFTLKQDKYKVLIRGTRAFRLTKAYSKIAGIVVSDTVPNATTKDPKEARWLDEGKEDQFRHLIVSDIEALDPFSALDHATEMVRLLTSFTAFHMHRERLAWKEQALVLDSQGHANLVKPPTLSIHKRPDVRTEDRLSNQVKLFADVVVQEKLSGASVAVLLRALRLHTDAVQSDQLTTQFIYLWTAIETLAPRDPSKARINSFLDFMIPFLCKGYPAKLLSDLSRSLEHQERQVYLNVLMTASCGQSRVDKLACIMVLPGEALKAKSLLSLCEGSPLLRQRLFRLMETLCDPRHVKRLIADHEERIRQHLQRMYRVRNMILHAGGSMPYLTTLVENLHGYFDRVVTVIVQEASLHPHAEREIEAIWAQVAREYRDHVHWLDNNKNAQMEPANFRTAIFGR